jgi:hypothetical protein
MSDGGAETDSHKLDRVTEDFFFGRPGIELSGSRPTESTSSIVLRVHDNRSPNPGQAHISEVGDERHLPNTDDANSARHLLTHPQARAQSPINDTRDPQFSQNQYTPVHESPRGRRDGDPLPSSAVIPIFVGLFLYTLATLIVVAWYVAYTNDETTKAGIEAALTMAGILSIAAVGPIWDEYQRLAGT